MRLLLGAFHWELRKLVSQEISLLPNAYMIDEQATHL